MSNKRKAQNLIISQNSDNMTKMVIKSKVSDVSSKNNGIELGICTLFWQDAGESQ
jgi:hypothetical protein